MKQILQWDGGCAVGFAESVTFLLFLVFLVHPHCIGDFAIIIFIYASKSSSIKIICYNFCVNHILDFLDLHLPNIGGL